MKVWKKTEFNRDIYEKEGELIISCLKTCI